MRLALLVAVLTLPLVAADCGGDDSESPGPTGCSIRVAGETLACAASAYDWSAYDAAATEWGFQLVGTRADGRVMATVQLFLPARPALREPYGWSGTASSVAEGWATFSTISGTTSPPEVTHEAEAPFFEGEAGTGALTIRFTAIPPPGATTEAQLMAVDGTVDATLEATDGSGRTIALHAEF